jgi:hypothetical protein
MGVRSGELKEKEKVTGFGNGLSAQISKNIYEKRI